MELEKLTALQLGEKIKQRQVSVLDGVKTVFEQIEKQDSEVHAYLDTYKEEAYKRAEEVQKGIEDGICHGKYHRNFCLWHYQKPMEFRTRTGRIFRWFLCSSGSRRNLPGTRL